LRGDKEPMHQYILAAPKSNDLSIIPYMDYRRLYVAGGTYFFTQVTYHRNPIFIQKAAIDVLRQAFRYTIDRHPFNIVASVILPDHLHLIWTLPPDDQNFPTRWRLIKSHFTREYARSNQQPPFWQRRYWEHLIRDEEDFSNHLDYIHFNPVKHGMVDSPEKWAHSTFKKFVASGYYPPEWLRTTTAWDSGEFLE